MMQKVKLLAFFQWNNLAMSITLIKLLIKSTMGSSWQWQLAEYWETSIKPSLKNITQTLCCLFIGILIIPSKSKPIYCWGVPFLHPTGLHVSGSHHPKYIFYGWFGGTFLQTLRWSFSCVPFPQLEFKWEKGLWINTFLTSWRRTLHTLLPYLKTVI